MFNNIKQIFNVHKRKERRVVNLIELTNKLIEKCHIKTYSELDFFRGVLEQWHR